MNNLYPPIPDTVVDGLVKQIEALRAENARLTAEIDKLKELLNKGHESLMRENEQLRWANAIKDASLLLDREPK